MGEDEPLVLMDLSKSDAKLIGEVEKSFLLRQIDSITAQAKSKGIRRFIPGIGTMKTNGGEPWEFSQLKYHHCEHSWNSRVECNDQCKMLKLHFADWSCNVHFDEESLDEMKKI